MKVAELARTGYAIRDAKMLECISCTLRYGLHDIPKVIRTFPRGLENNHAFKLISDNLTGMLTCVLFQEN